MSMYMRVLHQVISNTQNHEGETFIPCLFIKIHFQIPVDAHQALYYVYFPSWLIVPLVAFSDKVESVKILPKALTAHAGGQWASFNNSRGGDLSSPHSISQLI